MVRPTNVHRKCNRPAPAEYSFPPTSCVWSRQPVRNLPPRLQQRLATAARCNTLLSWRRIGRACVDPKWQNQSRSSCMLWAEAEGLLHEAEPEGCIRLSSWVQQGVACCVQQPASSAKRT